MKKIAILLGNITYGAGTERAVTNLANMLVTYGNYDVTIISIFSLSTMKPYFNLNENVKVVHLGLKNDSILNRINSYKTLISKMNQLIKREAYDFLLGTTHAFNCLMICMSKSIKKIACEHMSYEACPWVSKIIRFCVYPFLTKVILLSEYDRKKYFFLQKKQTVAISNSLSFVPSQSAQLLNKKIIAVGRLTSVKGFDYLLKAMINVRKKLPDWHLAIYGEGEEYEHLMYIINKENLDGYVTICPPTSDIEKELINSSIFVMSSRTEGMPMILIESKICGLPCVSFKSSETLVSLIKDGVEGYLVNMGDTDELSSKIISLANDYELRKRIGRNAKNSSVRYLPESIFLEWDNLFNNI